MLKFSSFVLLLILVKSIQLFASPCIVSLSSQKDKRIHALSIEAQNMLIMSSLIVSQLQPNVSSINIKVLLLSSLTMVRVNSRREGTFHNFSLIDRTLFTILTNLEILEDIQTFLLNQLGFNDSNMGPFSRRHEGGLILHLDKPPSIPMITNLNYDNTINILLDKVIASEGGKKKVSSEHLTFNELLLLVSPLRPFLFRVLHTENRAMIRSILYDLFNNLNQQMRQQIHPQKRRSYTQERKDEIIQLAIQSFEQQNNITIAEVVHKLNADINADITEPTLQKWLSEHEQTNGPIPGRRRHRKRSQQL